MIHKPQKIDGAAQAALAKMLIATEKQPSGPYKTWLIDANAGSDWLDVDIAVNANIGFMLGMLDVKLRGLKEFIDDAIIRNKLSSRYYIGQAPIIYFVSRNYKGAQSELLKQKVIEGLLNGSEDCITTAMLVSAGCNLKINSAELSRAIERILIQQEQGIWPANALYYEPPIKKINYYAGSSSLTTALSIEALRAYTKLLSLSESKVSVMLSKNKSFVQQAISQIELANTEVMKEYEKVAFIVASKDHDRQIMSIANVVSEAFHIELDPAIVFALNSASLNGWIAYSIYDDFIDDEGSSKLMGVANVAHRSMLNNFITAVPNEKFQKLVSSTLNRMDEANTWEAVRTRMSLVSGKVKWKDLPNYENLSQLAQRSSGHALGALGVLFLSRFKNDEDIFYMQKYFYHFLISRQLNDDAHDWWDDLSKGHFTSTVASLMKKWGKNEVDLANDHGQLSNLFWNEEIPHTVSIINYHVGKARKSLEAMPHIVNKVTLADWVDRLESSGKAALKAREDATVFIRSFMA